MCVYLTGPNALPVRIAFACEQIHPDASGGLEVWIDILLHNPNDRPLEEVLLIYPHRYGRVEPSGISPDAADETHSLSTGPEAAANLLYMQAGRIVHTPAGDPTACSILDVEIPNPHKLEEPIRKHGTYVPGSALRAGWLSSDALTDTELLILSVLEFSFWRCELPSPLGVDEARWFRWRFRSPAAPENTLGWWERVGRLLCGSIEFAHKVKGPHWLRDDLYSQLHAKRVELETRKVEGHEHLVPACIRLIGRLESCCVRQEDSLEIEDMRLHVFSGTGDVTKVYPMGVMVAGQQPNMLLVQPGKAKRRRGARRQMIYQWKTGRTFDLPKGQFFVTFSWVHRFFDTAVLAWTGIAIGALGCALAILSGT